MNFMNYSRTTKLFFCGNKCGWQASNEHPATTPAQLPTTPIQSGWWEMNAGVRLFEAMWEDQEGSFQVITVDHRQQKALRDQTLSNLNLKSKVTFLIGTPL